MTKPADKLFENKKKEKMDVGQDRFMAAKRAS